MGHALTTGILLTNVVLLLSLTLVGWRNRDEPSAGVFTLLQALSAVWAGLTVVGLAQPPGATRLRIWGLTTGLSLLVVPVWFGFILRYTGRDRWLTPRRFGLAVCPLVAAGLLYLVDPTWAPLVGELSQIRAPAGTLVTASIGPVGAVVGLYIYLVFLAGFVLVIRTVLEGNRLFVGQAIAFVLGTLVTVVASALVIAGIPAEGYPLTQAALGGQSLLLGYAVFRQQFLQVVPAVGRVGERAVVDGLDDGVIVLDDSGIVVRSNPMACRCLGIETLVGESVETVLDRLGVDALEDLPARFDVGGRVYQAKLSPVTSWRGETVGRTIAIRDVTGLVSRQQRLQVLNRIFRHNLRNEMTVVLGMADRLRAREDAELADMGESVADHVDSLTTISDKALTLERAFSRSLRTEAVDLAAVVDEVVGPLAETHATATISTTVTADHLTTDREILSLVLAEVVENACIHAGEAPTVSLEVAGTDEGIRIVVTDDGPGIPASELGPVRSGEETDLHHASSLGLWVLFWGTQSLHGEVDVAAAEDGTTVTLTLPDLADREVPADPVVKA